jgi:hypothetical protein
MIFASEWDVLRPPAESFVRTPFPDQGSSMGSRTRRLRRFNSLLDDATVVFGAGKAEGADGLHSVHASLGSPAGVGGVLPLIAESDPATPPLHSALVVSAAGNEHGRLAYLGGPVVSFASVP